MDDLLQQGIRAYKAGNRDEARKIFITVVKQNPESERAWGWMYNVSGNDEEREYCLKQILRINPINDKANQLLNQLLAPPFTSDALTSLMPSPAPVSPSQKQINSSDIAQNKNNPVDKKSAPKIIQKIRTSKNRQSKNRRIIGAVLGIGIIGLICVLAFGIWFSRQSLVTNLSPKLTTAPTIPPTGKWRVSTSKSEFDNSTTIVLLLDAENYVEGWLTTTLPTLILRCKEAKLDAYVNVGTQSNVEYGHYDSATVRVRFDQNQALEMIANESTDGEALFFRDPSGMIKSMLQSKEMVFGFTPFNADPAVTTFDLRGLVNAIKPLKQSCNK